MIQNYGALLMLIMPTTHSTNIVQRAISESYNVFRDVVALEFEKMQNILKHNMKVEMANIVKYRTERLLPLLRLIHK